MSKFVPRFFALAASLSLASPSVAETLYTTCGVSVRAIEMALPFDFYVIRSSSEIPNATCGTEFDFAQDMLTYRFTTDLLFRVQEFVARNYVERNSYEEAYDTIMQSAYDYPDPTGRQQFLQRYGLSRPKSRIDDLIERDSAILAVTPKGDASRIVATLKIVRSDMARVHQYMGSRLPLEFFATAASAQVFELENLSVDREYKFQNFTRFLFTEGLANSGFDFQSDTPVILRAPDRTFPLYYAWGFREFHELDKARYMRLNSSALIRNINAYFDTPFTEITSLPTMAGADSEMFRVVTLVSMAYATKLPVTLSGGKDINPLTRIKACGAACCSAQVEN